MIDTRGNDGLNGRRQRNGVDAAFQAISTSLALEIAPLCSGIGELLEEKWIALRTLDNIPAQQSQRRVLAEVFPQQPIRVRPCQRGHHDLAVMRALHECCGEARPVIDDEQRRSADDCIRQRLDKLFARRVDPVQVLDEDHGRRVVGACSHQRAHQIE